MSILFHSQWMLYFFYPFSKRWFRGRTKLKRFALLHIQAIIIVKFYFYLRLNWSVFLSISHSQYLFAEFSMSFNYVHFKWITISLHFDHFHFVCHNSVHGHITHTTISVSIRKHDFSVKCFPIARWNGSYVYLPKMRYWDWKVTPNRIVGVAIVGKFVHPNG